MPEVLESFVSAAERLTEQFYRWERRGRGWQSWPYAVNLEPPFRTFLGHFLAPGPQPVDDGRKPTWISNFIERLAGVSSSSSSNIEAESSIEEEPGPEGFTD